MHAVSVKCIQNSVGKLEDTKQHQGVHKRLIRSKGIRVWDVMTYILRYLRFSQRYCSLLGCYEPRKVCVGFVVDKGDSGAGCLPSVSFFSHVIIIAPVLRAYLLLHAGVIRRTSGRSLETFRSSRESHRKVLPCFILQRVNFVFC